MLPAATRYYQPTAGPYGREFLARATGELQRLPPRAAIEQMLADYQVMRDQVRACVAV